MSRPILNQLVRVLYAPKDMKGEWPDMAGIVGYVADVSADFRQARVQAITPDAQPGCVAWIDAAALEVVDDEQWAETFALYRERLNDVLMRRLRDRLDLVSRAGMRRGLTIDQFLTLIRRCVEACGRLPRAEGEAHE